MKQDKAEEIRELAERRKKIRKENARIFADFLTQSRKETLELMRRRHAYYSKLITDAKIKTAADFYENYRDLFLMYGIELKLSDNKSYCSIYLELGDYDYENYWVKDGEEDALAEVCPEVSFKELFRNVEVNIYTGDEL